jgi:hypothetical protein
MTDKQCGASDEERHASESKRTLLGRRSYIKTTAAAASAEIGLRLEGIRNRDLEEWQRVMAAADSGNGLSLVLDIRRHTFVNPDLTVYMHRPPAGEWVCLDAVTTPQPHGIGIADTRLYDERGPIGRAVQSLIIQSREAE